VQEGDADTPDVRPEAGQPRPPGRPAPGTAG
jgi:hypothetical protein